MYNRTPNAERFGYLFLQFSVCRILIRFRRVPNDKVICPPLRLPCTPCTPTSVAVAGRSRSIPSYPKNSKTKLLTFQILAAVTLFLDLRASRILPFDFNASYRGGWGRRAKGTLNLKKKRKKLSLDMIFPLVRLQIGLFWIVRIDFQALSSSSNIPKCYK